MNREKAKELSPIIQAFAEGKEIEILTGANHWDSCVYPHFDLLSTYRIKPEKKYRAFTMEEFKSNRDKWIKGKRGYILHRVMSITDKGAYCGSSSDEIKWSDLFDCFVFEDGSPCGVEITNG